MRLFYLTTLLAILAFSLAAFQPQSPQPALSKRSAPMLTLDGRQFKDLNRNGRLDPYEDWRQSPRNRASNLVAQMAVEDLAGVMVHGTLPAGASGGPNAAIGRGVDYDYTRSAELIGQRRMHHFITRLNGDPVKIAEANNRVQEIAENTRFGIPVTISTDPRNSFLYVPGATETAGAFSQWPESTGLAAINDPALTRKFADTVRREYLAVGIREALSPQADLATEPRWPRINGTFGEDPDLARAHVESYVEGMQDGRNGLKSTSVITIVKHWVGYGAARDGWDGHNFYGQHATVTSSSLATHVKPFLGAFQARVAGVMPTYSILDQVRLDDGKPMEPVAAGFSRQLLQGLLREKYKFDGVVVSDWGITSDCTELCQSGMPAGQRPGPAQIGMPWGVMHLTRQQRFAKAIEAGIDQVGGTEDVVALIEAARSGAITSQRMREAATRILEQKFAIGLFENPYVDAAEAGKVVGNPDSHKAGVEAQQRAMVLLENKTGAGGGAGKPIVKAGARVWLFQVEAAAARKAGLTVVDSPEKADVAILRAATPFETLHPGYFFGLRHHEGRLHFQPGDPAYDALVRCNAARTPTVMTVYLDRPAILSNVKDKVAALYGDFGVNDDALLAVLTGSGGARATGRLPFELPSSMEAVAAQKSDLPHDSARPLYRFGYAWKQ